jgi:hypothetical protein
MFYITLLSGVSMYAMYELTSATHKYTSYNKEFIVTFLLSLVNIGFMIFVAAAPFAGIEVTTQFYFAILSIIVVSQLGIYSAMRIDTTKIVILTATAAMITVFFNTLIIASNRLA